MNSVLPKEHWNPPMEKVRPYITAVVKALLARHVNVRETWLDPFYPDPRDATIRIGESEALVWNEEQGWLRGTFVRGRQGERTVLGDPAGLGGGVLPTVDEVADRYVNGTRTPIVLYRRLTDHDDFDEALGVAGERLLVNS
jgi:hypothetical protein